MNRIFLLSTLVLLGACSRNNEKNNPSPKSADAPEQQVNSNPDQLPIQDNSKSARDHKHVVNYPNTKLKKHVDHYFGQAVEDHYRWLEEADAPEVKSWSAEQNDTARNYLAQLPKTADIRNAVTKLLSSNTFTLFDLQPHGPGLFALKRQPPNQQPFIVHIATVSNPDKLRVLVDPNKIDSSGRTTIDWFQISPNAKYIAVSLSKSGTEVGDVHIFNIADGSSTGEIVPRVNGGTAGGSLSWSTDSKGFYYTRYPRATERPPQDLNFYVQVFHHTLGQDTELDRYELGKDFPRIAEIQLSINASSGQLLASVQKGDGGIFSHHLRTKSGTWQQISKFEDRVVQVSFGRPGELYMVSRKDTPRGKLLRIATNNLDLISAETIIPESEKTIQSSFMKPPSVVSTPNRLYVAFQMGGPSEIHMFDHQGVRKSGLQQTPLSGSSHIIATGKQDEILFHRSSYLKPGMWLRFDGKSRTFDMRLAQASPVDLSRYEVVREFSKSKDGTKVPINIIKAKGIALDASHPCLVTAYGGYGISLSPSFSIERSILLDQGFVYAIANLRGGGEYGERWHKQGNLVSKQNVFDDFSAVLNHLSHRRYTSSDKTAIMGASNGGLLMAATMVQHPEKVAAVISSVGIYDMLRFERSANGAFNVTEFGTVSDPQQFKALYAYSPYHNVVNGTKYPPALFFTGSNDPRVDPMHSRKMIARLQAASAGTNPILLRTEENTGHGNSTPLSQRIEEFSDVLAFVFHQLGHTFNANKTNPVISLKK